MLYIVIEDGEKLKKDIFIIYQNIPLNFVGYFYQKMELIQTVINLLI